MTTRCRLWLTAAAVALAAPAQAANIGLAIDAGAEGENGGFAILGDTLNAQGYEVYERTGADRDAMREALSEVAARIDDAERLVLAFAGSVYADEGRVWLLPEGYDGETRVDAAFDGVAVELLLDLASERPGRSVVIVAYDATEESEAVEGEDAAEAAAARAAEAEQGWARAQAPQGVLVLVGPREAALAAVAERLLEAGVSAAEAVADLEDVRVYGFASPDMSFGDMADAAEAPAPAPVEAAEAPEPEPDPRPEEAAEAAEAELGLDQAARRAVQENLTMLGYETRGIDGIIGPGTRAAIREWQDAQGFEATGFLTQDQVARLNEQGAERSAELRRQAERARAEEEAADAAFWRTTGAGGAPADLRAYLARYPDGVYAAEARAQLEAHEAEYREQAEAADRADWDAAVEDGTAEAFRGYLDERPDGAFAEEAEERIREIEDAPRLEAAREEAREREERLGLNTASRALIESQLAAIGHDVGDADGSFDDASREAIRAFQSRMGMEATGYVDQETVQALIAASLGLR
jgi:peptidoglycan hydrolase-like protein with peptidoglycan-binding domain